MTLRLGVLGLGSVCSGPYARLIHEPALEGRVDLVAGYDPAPAKVEAAARRFGLAPDATGPEQVYAGVDVDVVLVEKPMAIELYGSDGVLQMQGDDWAPEGFEQWSNARGSWEVFGETDPNWPWTVGLRHLVDCVESGRPTVTRPEHAFHALEVIQAARLSSSEGKVVEIESDFPALDYSSIEPAGADHRRAHDPRS
jgi:predicted dehydrogenase